ncbi:hypothetical protein C8Q74DRAFT_176892 [Fomes fomentarius]|nr:hypothetical protein C8Q74DRAFT_176892 [Fomes fomentarius]
MEQEQKDHYQRELASVRAKLSTQTRRPAVVIQNGLEKLPWNRAAALLPDLIAHGVWDSSAWIIDYAHTEWKRVYQEIMRGGYTETLDGRCYSAGFGLIEGLTNAIVADRRIFHIADNNFLDKYNSQLIFEISMIRSGDWTSLGSKRVIEEVPRRLKAEARGAGWSTVRPALSLAIRGWIMRGVVESGLKESPETALEFLTSAVEVLTWVGERYKDVPDKMKGAIFRPTFIRAVKSMRLDIFRLYPLKDLQAGVDEILAELGDVPMQPYVDSVGFYHAFFRYPAGQAHAFRAFCHRANAMLLRQAQGVTQEVCSLFRMAGQEYTEATKYYPLDEECSTLYAYCAFQAHWEAGAPLKYLLLLLDQMDKSIPLMKRIWEFSADASSSRDALFQRALDQRDVWWDSIRNGRISEDSFVQKVVLQE